MKTEMTHDDMAKTIRRMNSACNCIAMTAEDLVNPKRYSVEGFISVAAIIFSKTDELLELIEKVQQYTTQEEKDHD